MDAKTFRSLYKPVQEINAQARAFVGEIAAMSPFSPEYTSKIDGINRIHTFCLAISQDGIISSDIKEIYLVIGRGSEIRSVKNG